MMASRAMDGLISRGADNGNNLRGTRRNSGEGVTVEFMSFLEIAPHAPLDRRDSVEPATCARTADDPSRASPWHRAWRVITGHSIGNGLTYLQTLPA